ncbi:uncharacterized protein LOC143885903 [Tasmannia lanceolata]|uniref:uncharacterized protein LOC143885903 n=1 Tax=Tasmannia lanceolata TaxID=3420 RepID=UPI004063FB79
MAKHFFLIRFSNVEYCTTALESQVHNVGGRPLILQKWAPCCSLEKRKLSSIPLWIKLPGLHLKFWSKTGLSKITSSIEKPLYMDSQIASGTRLGFARVCIEVEADKILPDSIQIHTPQDSYPQSIEYDWKPTVCHSCKDFSHSSDRCPKSPPEARSTSTYQAAQKCQTKKWVLKTFTPSPNPGNHIDTPSEETRSWSNCSKSGDIKLRRLDRALVNGIWIQKFPNSLGIYKYPNISDHSPIVVQTQESPPLDAKPFRFINAWLEDSSLFEIVERSWQSETFGNPMFLLVSKLKKTKDDLKKWNKESFGRVDLQLPIVRQKHEDIQKKISTDLQNLALRREESVLKDQFLLTARREEEIARQRNINCIQATALPNGEITSNQAKVVKEADGNKSPGPDGFNGEFFKAFWYLIKNDVVKAVQNFFVTGNLLKEVNATFITLIPKSTDSCFPDKYRPISLCNFLYKIISKILDNRLHSVLGDIISQNQTAFIKGRSIQENILLTRDLLHNFHRASQSSSTCLKLDLQKAFDNEKKIQRRIIALEQSVRWLSLPGRVKLITECISTPVFSVLINGSPQGFFPSSNGLRQGDPLSSLLFYIHMEMLTCILNEVILSKTISTPFSKKDIHISHLLLADDVVIFANCLDRFSYCSGLSLNRQKSEVFFNNSNNFQKDLICYILGIPSGSLPIRYLKPPLITSKLSAKDCSPLVSKIWKRLAAWNNLTLSRARRIELIKTVLISFQVYWSAAFNLPIQILEEIEKIFKKFIWSGSNQTKNIHLIAWDNLCKPKAEGGVGIRHLRDINQVGQMKQFWALASGKPSLWKDWISRKYIRSQNLWTIPMPSSPSWGFRGILQTREIMKKLVCYAIGDGKGIDFWKQPWHPNGAISDIVSAGSFNIHPKNVQVIQLYSGNSWHPHLQDLKEIISTTIITPGPSNMAIWKPSSSGEFDSMSAWNSIQKKSPRINWAPSIWFPGHVPEFATTAWLALNGRLTTRDRLGFLGPNRDLKCPLCHTAHESIDHIFFQCSYSRWVWNSVLWGFNLRKNPKRSLLFEEEWLRRCSRGKVQSATALRLAFQTAIFFIWFERNKRIHEKKETHKQSVLKHILHSVRSRICFLKLNDGDLIRSKFFSENFDPPLFEKKDKMQSCIWQKPDPGWSKLNSNASLTDSEGSIGGIIRDHIGTTTALFSSQKAKSEINILELQAISHGLELAKSKNICKIWVESDSLSAVETISKGV